MPHAFSDFPYLAVLESCSKFAASPVLPPKTSCSLRFDAHKQKGRSDAFVGPVAMVSCLHKLPLSRKLVWQEPVVTESDDTIRVTLFACLTNPQCSCTSWLVPVHSQRSCWRCCGAVVSCHAGNLEQPMATSTQPMRKQLSLGGRGLWRLGVPMSSQSLRPSQEMERQDHPASALICKLSKVDSTILN